MHRWAVALAATAACRFAPVAATLGGDDGSVHDGTDPFHDAPPGSEPAGFCFGSSALDTICLPAITTTPLMFASNTTIDTDSTTMCTDTTANGVPVCVIHGSSITIANNVTVDAHGGRPLVLVATATNGGITLMGMMSVLDVGSHLGGAAGAASFSGALCQVGATAATGDGGGAGGAFAGHGGNGGADNNNSGAGIAGAALAAPTALHGGCRGDTGSGVTLSSLAAGGGGVALIAPMMIHVDGVVAAAGAGGAGAPSNGGGGGGGAGGMIVLDAPTINGMGTLVAQGGGGGEGSSGNAGANGFDGFDATHRGMDTLGGSGGSSGGDGGDGASNTQTVGAAGGGGVLGGAASGGGGGGGGPGVILALAGVPATMLVFSPPHQ